ncbi:hypothetical protein ACW2QC_09865 [Virgibacillus sp. FSP13]
MMRHYAILRLLLACFFLYFAWPLIPQATTQLEGIFWGAWLILFLLVVGANLSTLLRMTNPPVMEQERERIRQTHNH